MEINFNFTINAVAIVTGILAWGFIISLAYRVYKKQSVRLKVWKILLVMFVGLFSFSFKWNMFDTMVKFPILPLGVWILYFILKGREERWQTYRSFAWLGFWANFIFLGSTLIAIPFHHMIYPKNEPSTYISNVDNASILNIYPSAKGWSLNKESLLNQLDTMSQETIFSEQWYEDTYMNTESNKSNERFPYQLIGISSKWGSGLYTIIYITLGVIVLYAITSILLKKNKYDKYIGIVFVGLLLLSIAIIVISFIVGGWAGMGVGFIGLSILIGAIIGGFISSLISHF